MNKFTIVVLLAVLLMPGHAQLTSEEIVEIARDAILMINQAAAFNNAVLTLRRRIAQHAPEEAGVPARQGAERIRNAVASDRRQARLAADRRRALARMGQRLNGVTPA